MNVLAGSTSSELASKYEFARKLRQSAIPDAELLDNLGLLLIRRYRARLAKHVDLRVSPVANVFDMARLHGLDRQRTVRQR